jgi:hypothetical protein
MRLCFYVVRATPSAASGPMNTNSDTWHVFSVWFAPCNNRGVVFSVRGACRDNMREYGNGNWLDQCGGRVEYLRCGPASRRRRQKGRFKSETVKYGREAQGTRTLERLRCKGQQHIQKTDPSSRQRGRLTNQDCICQTVTNIWSWAPDGARHQDLLTDRPSVAMWLTLTLTLTLTWNWLEFRSSKGTAMWLEIY